MRLYYCKQYLYNFLYFQATYGNQGYTSLPPPQYQQTDPRQHLNYQQQQPLNYQQQQPQSLVTHSTPFLIRFRIFYKYLYFHVAFKLSLLSRLFTP